MNCRIEVTDGIVFYIHFFNGVSYVYIKSELTGRFQLLLRRKGSI